MTATPPQPQPQPHTPQPRTLAGSRVLVTGASGFVGRWLTRALRLHDVSITALGFGDELTTARTEADADPGPAMHWMEGDLRDDAFVRKVVHLARPDFVVHLAAISHVPTATSDPGMAWDVNVTATARFLHHLGQARIDGALDPTILLVGSAEQYGTRRSADPVTEDAEQAPRTVYAATKAAQEVLGRQLWRATGLRVQFARSFNHSGRGQPPNFLLPALAARAVGLRSAPPATPLMVGNTTPIRDFLHVTDVVAAYISLLQHGVPGEAYNVASGIGRSVQDIVERVLERANVVAPIETDPALMRPVDVPALVGNPLKLQSATGWQATRTFDDILDELIHAATH